MLTFDTNNIFRTIPNDEFLEVTYSDFKRSFRQNRHLYEKTFKWHFDLIQRIFDSQQILFRHHYWTLNVVGSHGNEIKRVTASAYLKSMHAILSATELTKLGLYGSARALVRQVFEFIIIGKFASVTGDSKYCVHWLSLGHVDITRQILNKIEKPDTREFRRLYKLLCEYNHATSASQQIGAKTKFSLDNIKVTLVYIALLLECNYHLLNSHFFDSSMKYHAREFELETIKKEVVSLKRCFKELRTGFYGRGAKTFISDYKKSWTIKT